MEYHDYCKTCGEPWDKCYASEARRIGDRGFIFDGLIMTACPSCELHKAQGYPLVKKVKCSGCKHFGDPERSGFVMSLGCTHEGPSEDTTIKALNGYWCRFFESKAVTE